jgi:hypothetical protein
MPNVTISVPDDLKAEMDKLAEVSWSGICRKAIRQYIAERKYPTPAIDLDLRDVRLDNYHRSGYPTLTATLKIHNKMNIEIVVDRILFEVRFNSAQQQREYPVGSNHNLYRTAVNSNSIGQAQLFLPFFEWQFMRLEGKFASTFPCTIRCIVIANGFKNSYHQDVRTEIPIDKWKEFVKKALETRKAAPT